MNQLEAKTLVPVIAMIGGILGMVCVFLTWTEAGYGFEAFTGWDFLTTMENSDYHKYLPGFVLGLSVVAFVLTAISYAKPDKTKVFGLMMLIIGIVIVLATVLFLFWDMVLDFAGLGLYLAIIAGILVLAVGIFDLFFKKN